MMEIALRASTSPDELLAASTAMMDRAVCRERRLVFLAVSVPLALAGGLGVAGHVGYPLGAEWLVAIYTALGVAVGQAPVLGHRGRGCRRALWSASRARSPHALKVPDGWRLR